MGADYGIDLDEVRRVIDSAEVLVVRFSVSDRRLLIDSRTNDEAGPMVRVVPKATSVQDRFRAIKALRPRFRVPLQIMTFHWPRHARSLEESGIWEHIRRRMIEKGGEAMGRECDEALRQLCEEERRVEVAAVTGGEGFQTLWPAGVHDE